MAVILQFRRSERPATPGEPKEHGLGQVVIFPGVRIERYADKGRPSNAAAPRKRAQRARKKHR